MKKVLIGLAIVCTLMGSFAGATFAETSSLDWGLFKIYNSPSWVWGQNGAIITPTANVAGNGVYFTGYIIQTGTYNNEPAAFSTNTLQMSSGNLEVGITKKYLLLNWERLDVDSTILHAKFQPFVTNFLNVAIGTVGVQVSANPFEGSYEEKFFNDVFAVAGLRLGPISANVGGEMGIVGGEEKTKPFFFGNAIIKLGGLAVVGEVIGLPDAKNLDNLFELGDNGQYNIFNVGLSTNYKHINFGVGAIDLANSGEKLQYTAYAAFRY